MMIRLQYLWERMRTSYWLLPSWMLLSAALLAWLALYVDSRIGLEVLDGVAWALVVSSEGATAVMSTIAGSMVTIAGVVFSITLVALSLASGQFGPRMLRNFIRDRVNQTALGAFLATFLYCLLVLSAIRHDPLQPFVPHIAVGLGVVLAVISVVTLIIYIHHVAVTIQAQSGGNLAEILDGLSKVVRARFKLFRRVRAITAEAKWSGMFLSGFPIAAMLMISMVKPDYYDEVKGTALFIPVALVVCIFLVINVLYMRKMVNIQV